MKKLFLSLLCAICVVAVKAETITIQGALFMVANPCTTEPCMPGLDIAICTPTTTFYITNPYTSDYVNETLQINTCDMLFTEGDEVVATGTVNTRLDINNEEYYVIDITSIHLSEETPNTLQGEIGFADAPCLTSPCIHDVTCEPEMPCEPEPSVALAFYTENRKYYITNTYTSDISLDGDLTITLLDTQIKEGDVVVVKGEVTTHIDVHDKAFYCITIESISVGKQQTTWCTQWNVLRSNGSLGPSDYPRTYIFVAYGDTIIADKTYAKIGRYWSLEPEKQEYVAAIRQQGDSVLVHHEHADYLLYDFGVKEGDEREVFVGINNWGHSPTGTFANKVTAVSILPDGRKKISVDIYYGDKNSEYYEWEVISSDWIEGVGSVSGLLYTGSFGGLVGSAGYILLCASNEDGCVYTGELFEQYGCEYNRIDDTALEEIQTEPINAHKAIENGHLIIVRDGVRYNVLGAQL